MEQIVARRLVDACQRRQADGETAAKDLDRHGLCTYTCMREHMWYVNLPVSIYEVPFVPVACSVYKRACKVRAARLVYHARKSSYASM